MPSGKEQTSMSPTSKGRESWNKRQKPSFQKESTEIKLRHTGAARDDHMLSGGVGALPLHLPLGDLPTFSTKHLCASRPSSSSNCGSLSKSLNFSWVSVESSIKWVTWPQVVSKAPDISPPPSSGHIAPFYFLFEFF